MANGSKKKTSDRMQKQIARQLEYEMLLEAAREAERYPGQTQEQYEEATRWLQPKTGPKGHPLAFTDESMMQIWGPQSKPGAPSEVVFMEFDNPNPTTRGPQAVMGVPSPNTKMEVPVARDPELAYDVGSGRAGSGGARLKRQPDAARQAAFNMENIAGVAHYDPDESRIMGPEGVFYRTGSVSRGTEDSLKEGLLNPMGSGLQSAWDSLDAGQIEQLNKLGDNQAKADLMMEFYYDHLDNLAAQGVDISQMILTAGPELKSGTHYDTDIYTQWDKPPTVPSKEDMIDRANYFFWKKFTEGKTPSTREDQTGSSKMLAF